MSTLLQRKPNEGYYDYLDRLFTHKVEYRLDCNKIADLMNAAFGYDFSESKYRKQWTYFNDGRNYERGLHGENVHRRILSISDAHVPYNLPVGTLAEHAGKVDILVINGDVTDMQAISRFPKAYRESPLDEIVTSRQFLIDLIEHINPNEVYITYGNHDVRFQSYLTKNLDTDLLELMPMTPLDLIVDDGFRRYDKRSKSKTWYDPLVKVFPDKKIVYANDWKVKIGKTWFVHPIAFSGGNLRTAEKAMEFFLKSDREPFDAVVMAHTHRTGDLKKGYITIFEQGAFCQTEKMNYTDGRLSDPQQKGYIVVAQDKEGNLLYNSTKRFIL